MSRMYTLALAGIVAITLSTAGCGGAHHPAGWFDAVWSIGWLGDGPTDCQTAGVVEVSVDVADAYNPNIFFNDSFNCLDYGGQTGGLPPSDYTVAIRAWSSPSATVPLSEVVFSVPYRIYANTVTNLPPTRLDVQYH